MRLLMATGGAPHSDLALRLGAQIARRAGAVPTILTVVKRPGDRSRADAIFDRARQVVQPELSDFKTVVYVGSPAEEIVAEARRGDYDLVIIGERPRHSFMARFLGSTATHIVERAPCPVIVAKGKINPVHRILLCDSGAGSASLLSRFPEQLPWLAEADVDITVLHVMSQIGAGPRVVGAELRLDAEDLIRRHALEGELLERDVRMLSRPHLTPRPKVRHGLVVEEILAEAQSGDYDLVAIGAHLGVGWQRLLLDDIAHQIIVEVDRPVLVMR